MSDAEVNNGLAAEAPTAEDLKAKKRSAEVSCQRYQRYQKCPTLYIT